MAKSFIYRTAGCFRCYAPRVLASRKGWIACDFESSTGWIAYHLASSELLRFWTHRHPSAPRFRQLCVASDVHAWVRVSKTPGVFVRFSR